MSVLTDIWRQLVRRRLLPVALLLVAALVAVPMLLAKEPEATETATPATPVETADSALAEAPIVTASEVSTRQKGRKVLGDKHDIFKSTIKKPKTAKKSDDDTTESEDQTEKPADDGSGGSANSGGGGTPSGPATPGTPATPAPKPKTYPLYSLKVRFSGGSSGESIKGYLPIRAALPSSVNPLIIYLGLTKDHKSAVFMLDSTVQAVGDGECNPTPESCETVRMREGDTMFFDVVGADGTVSGDQFQIDLLDINKKQTTDAAKAAKSSRLTKAAASSTLGGSESLRRLGVVTRTG